MPHAVRGLVCCVLILVAAPRSLLPQAPPPGWSAFAATFDRYMAGDSIVGGGIMLLEPGTAVARHERGWQDRERREPAAPATIYHYGSMTKTLTAVAIMQLRDRGLLSLDDRVTDYLPELRQVHDPYGSMDDVTIRMLLSHSAGFQNPTWPWGGSEPWQPFEPTRWEQLVSMMPYMKLHFAPGSRYGYSNPAFIYLARILERVTGTPYESYIQKNIWTPLGMTRSYFGHTPWWLAEDRSNRYAVVEDSAGQLRVEERGREFDPGITIPNGGWNAPLGDVAVWARFLTGSPSPDPAVTERYDTVLSPTSLREMWQPVVAADSGIAPSSMGLSFYLIPIGQDTLVGHTGEQGGYRAFFFMNRRTGRAILGAVNTTNEAAYAPALTRWHIMVRAALEVIAR